MGATSSLSCVLHSEDVQIALKTQELKDVAEILKRWSEQGMPLGLTLSVFEQLFQLGPDMNRALFTQLDTDTNQKVDAFEALSSAILLAGGTHEEKLEKLFPIFDFTGTGLLNFDETNILIQCVHRGLEKVCCTPFADEDSIVEVCKQLFDTFNLPYEKQISKEQIRRWMMNDIDASKYLNAFISCEVISKVEIQLKTRKELV